MPIKEPLLAKTVLGNTTFTLKADPGEAFMVRDILVRSPSTNYMSVKIDKALVGYFRVGGVFGSHQTFRRGHARHGHTIRLDDGSGVAVDHHAPLRSGDSVNSTFMLALSDAPSGDVRDLKDTLLYSGEPDHGTLLEYLAAKGIFKGFPIAEGQTMTIEGIAQSSCIITVLYEQWDPADIKPEMENGSLSNEYFFLNYGNCGASVQATADNLYTTAKSPAEFPDFPFGKVVPANTAIDILGLLASTFSPKENDGTNYSNTKFIKLVRERETLFDEDRVGLIHWSQQNTAAGGKDNVAQGFSVIGGYSEHDNGMPLMFTAPMTFNAGDELNVYLTIEVGGSGQAIAIDEHEICLVTKVRRGAK